MLKTFSGDASFLQDTIDTCRGYILWGQLTIRNTLVQAGYRQECNLRIVPALCRYANRTVRTTSFVFHSYHRLINFGVYDPVNRVDPRPRASFIVCFIAARATKSGIKTVQIVSFAKKHPLFVSAVGQCPPAARSR